MNKYLYAIGAVVVSLALTWGFTQAYGAGKQSIQVKWDLHEAERDQEIRTIQAKYSALQDEFTGYVEASRKTLFEKENAYKRNIRALNTTHVNQLRDSEQRATRYQREAENDNGQCRGLATHAGKLDRTIVRGQYVVNQLIEAIERRNAHVKFIGGILIEEQKLITGE